jgi:dienelactone hydrolase
MGINMFKQCRFTLAALVVALPFSSPAWAADPLDPLVTQCEGPAGDPAPGTPQFVVRDLQNIACSEQRHVDSMQHPVNIREWLGLYGSDPYREPSRHNGTRFRYEARTISGAAGEIYRPCTATSCPNLPAGLQTFEPPYPVAIVLHGLASDKRHLWWAIQPLAEAGYFVITVNGTGSNLPGDVLNWINGPAQAAFPGELDVNRVGITGHSLGAENSTRTQGDPRVSAIIAWDPCDNPTGCTNSAGSNLHGKGAAAKTPTLFMAADYSGFPGYAQPRTSIPTGLRVAGYGTLRNNGVDSMLLTPRATTHLDWAGTFTFGTRFGELTYSHFNLAWFDRYLKGKLVLDGDGNVVTSGGRTEAQERSYRQALAQSGFDRLVATQFDDSADRHNISQGFWDPVMAVMNADPLYGGNVPYSVAGKPIADRLSFYYRSVCFVSLPDYNLGAGKPGDPLLARGDTTAAGDMRQTGCPVEQFVTDADGDGVLDDADQCPDEAGPASNNGCPLPPPDTTPDAFSFTSLSGVAQGSVVSSNVVTITGIDAPASISIAVGEYRINGGAYTSSGQAAAVNNGDTVQVRHTSANAPGTTVESVVSIGGVEGKFRSTTSGTAGNDTDPDAFSFGTKTGQQPSTEVASDPQVLTGYDAPAPVTAGSGTQYSLDCSGTNWTNAPGTLNVGQSICVRHTTASGSNALRKTSLKVGTVVGYFTTRTTP